MRGSTSGAAGSPRTRRDAVVPRLGGGGLVTRRDDHLTPEQLAAARAGDPEGIEAVYRRYAPGVLAWHRARVSDQHLAEDLTSEAFLAVLRGLPRFEGGP